MKSLITACAIFLFTGICNAQSTDTTRWNTSAVRNASYQSDFENEVLKEINKLRSDPPAYARLYLEPMIRDFKGNVNTRTRVETQEGVAPLKECIAQLSITEKMEMLDGSKELHGTAAAHTNAQSKTRQVGHTSPNGKTFQERLKVFKFRLNAECIAYGETEARGVVLSLLIDDGVPNRGHRKTLLDTRFRMAGVGNGKHLTYGTMCTIDFALK